MRKFFSAALKGVVSSQVEEALANPQVTVDARPVEGKEQQEARRPSLLDYLVPGYSLMFVFFLISNLAATVIEERQTGTLQRLLVAPVPRSRILLGKMIPYFLIAAAQFTVILLASKLIFGIDLGNSVLALGVIILASSLAVVSLGILIAAFARSEGQASGLTIVLVLAMAVVSGAMFPNIAIPGIQALTPHYWAMQGFVNTIARGQDVQGVLLPAGILLTMSAVFFTIGAVRFRFE
jgi:ABC-2 type transport system permease protein